MVIRNDTGLELEFEGELNDGTTYGSTTHTPPLSWPAIRGNDFSHYELAVGSTYGGQEILPWKSVGEVTSDQIPGLSLTNSLTYYPSVRVINKSGEVGRVINGDGWRVEIAGLTYSQVSTWFYKNLSISPLIPTFNHFIPKSFSIIPSLPSGMTFNTLNGSISGTPTQKSYARNYTITASDGVVSKSVTISFGVGLRFVVNIGTDDADTQPGDEVCSDLNGDCSLRAAFDESNTLIGYKTRVDIPVIQDIVLLSNTSLVLNAGRMMEINGHTNKTVIRGTATASYSLIQLNGVPDFSLRNVNLTLGRIYAPMVGGAGLSSVNSVVKIFDSMINHNFNQGDVGSNGGGIYARGGRLEISSTSFSGNRSYFQPGEQSGGAIAAFDLDLLITGSSFNGNIADTGAGIYLDNVIGSIDLSNFTGNTATTDTNPNGGAIYASTDVDLTINRSFFWSNEASLNGGAIYSADFTNLLRIQNSRFYGNMANIQKGGALFILGFLDLKSSLFYNNRATSNAQISIDAAGTSVMQNITISDSMGPTAGLDGIANISIYNSIIDTTGNGCTSMTPLISNYNIEGGNTCGFIGSHDLFLTNPLIDKTAVPFASLMLLPTSPARNYIPQAQCVSIVTDQRDLPRPGTTPGDTNCDVGALEMQNNE